MKNKPRVTIIGDGRIVREGDTATYYHGGVMVAVHIRHRLIVSDTASADARGFVVLWSST